MRKTALFVGVLLLVVGIAPGAVADPKGVLPFDLECDGVPSGSITANGRGNWAPAFDPTSNGVYIPYAVEVFFYFTPDDGVEELIGSESMAKKNVPKNAKNLPHGRCTFGVEFPVEGDPELGNGTGRIAGTVWVFYTG